ncbi:MAG: MBOAT family O-acyltransferase [Pseudomonadota bacterium]
MTLGGLEQLNAPGFGGDFPGDYLAVLIIPAVIAGFMAFEILIRLLRRYPEIAEPILTILFAATIFYLSPSSFFWLAAFGIGAYLLIRQGLLSRLEPLTFVVGLLITIILIKQVLPPPSFANPLYLIGFSYFMFRVGAFVLEYANAGPQKPLPDFGRYLLWLFWLPVFTAGPIMRFESFKRLDIADDPAFRTRQYSIIMLGLALKFFLVDYILESRVLAFYRADLLPTLGDQSFGFSLAVIETHGLFSFLHGYVDLWVYSILAQALSRLFGYDCPDNFRAPLLATNIADFWRRWHITLSGWARDYVFFPLLLRYRNPYIANVATMLTIGLWHAFNINWILWSLSHAGAMILHDLHKKSKIAKALAADSRLRWPLAITGNILTIGFVAFIYNLVALPNDYAFAREFMIAGLLPG